MSSIVQLRVLSFGYGHGEPPPAADITLDVREWFRDPHVSPQMRTLTGLDAEVYANVTAMPGVLELVIDLHRAVAVLVGLDLGTVTVAFGCVGGRHRSVVLARLLAARAREAGWSIELRHLHVERPVLGTRLPPRHGVSWSDRSGPGPTPVGGHEILHEGGDGARGAS